MKTIGIYPGTFDPITKGHLDIIKRALLVVDKLIIAVSKVTNKNTLFNQDKRVELVKEDVKDLPTNEHKLEVLPFKGLLVDFVKETKANFIIRGLRSGSDFEYEFRMAAMNKKLFENVETIFLPAIESTQFISSSIVKEIASLNGGISGFVSKNVEKELKKIFAKSN
jgi:pantetheine-phosphate adenylyltransferase